MNRDARPSGPPALPLLGHILPFLSGKLEFLTRCAAQYGDVVRLRIGEPTLLLTNPDDIKHVLVGNASNYNKTRLLTSARGRQVSGSGLHTSFGAEHLRQRRLLQPVFQRQSIEIFVEVMLDRTRRQMAGWRNGSEIELAAEMELLALSIIIGALFGKDYHDEGGRLAQAITVRRAYLEYRAASLLPFPEYLPAPVVFQYRRAMRVIDGEILRAMLENGDGTFASRIVNAQYPDGSRMPDRLARDEILTLMSTGYETIGDALAWTLYLLTQHPEVESKVLDELGQVLGGESPRVEDMSKLTYTRQVLDESLRLYPPTWLFVRMALGEDRLPSGADVAAGSKLYLCQYVMHRHPNYFPDPERFDPDRFSAAASQGRPRFAYFPFGGGPRTCIGEHFALLEGILVLALLLPRFRFELPSGQTIVPRPGITLRPRDGIRAVVRPR